MNMHLSVVSQFAIWLVLAYVRRSEWRTGARLGNFLSMLLIMPSLPVRRVRWRAVANRSVRQFATPLEGGERRDPLDTDPIEN